MLSGLDSASILRMYVNHARSTVAALSQQHPVDQAHTISEVGSS
jgi:hypothetical protein